MLFSQAAVPCEGVVGWLSLIVRRLAESLLPVLVVSVLVTWDEVLAPDVTTCAASRTLPPSYANKESHIKLNSKLLKD